MSGLSRSSTAAEIVAHLRSIGSEENRQGMKRYGIRIDRALGISHGVQRDIAKKIGRNHARAFDLWASGITEAQFIASRTADPDMFTIANARDWAASFDSWDIVDGVSDLFVDTHDWTRLIAELAADEREFARRAAFAMMAWSVVHRKTEPEATFLGFLAIIEEHADDERNFVKKAVNWALRSIGKRSLALNAAARDTAEHLVNQAGRAARWNGKNALRELSAPATLSRVAERDARQKTKLG